jgi:plasmid stabilization system protein ParE
MVVIWLPKADEMVQEIYHFYATKSETVALKIVIHIRDAAARLANAPWSAPVEPLLAGFTRTYRSCVVRHLFKLVYFVDEAANKIIIADVWDCRRNPASLKKEIRK